MRRAVAPAAMIKSRFSYVSFPAVILKRPLVQVDSVIAPDLNPGAERAARQPLRCCAYFQSDPVRECRREIRG